MDMAETTPETDPRDWDRWPCLCPDAYIESACFIDDCPRHTLGPNLEAALQRDHEREMAQERIELARSRAAAQRAGTLRVFTADGQEIEYDENDVPRPKVGD